MSSSSKTGPHDRRDADPPEGEDGPRQWNFLTNHALVLICIARDPGTRLRDVAVDVGITERAVHRIMVELVDEGYLTRHRVGRRNRYDVHLDAPLRHSLVDDQRIGDVLPVETGDGLSASGSRRSSKRKSNR